MENCEKLIEGNFYCISLANNAKPLCSYYFEYPDNYGFRSVIYNPEIKSRKLLKPRVVEIYDDTHIYAEYTDNQMIDLVTGYVISEKKCDDLYYENYYSVDKINVAEQLKKLKAEDIERYRDNMEQTKKATIERNVKDKMNNSSKLDDADKIIKSFQKKYKK